MSVKTPETRKETVQVVRGQLHKFMLIPILEDEIEWFPAGPVTFGVEARALADRTGKVGERGASIHVFDNDRKTERLRFDCFENTPHYHYIIQRDQHNIVWGYDPAVNESALCMTVPAFETLTYSALIVVPSTVRTRKPQLASSPASNTTPSPSCSPGVAPAASLWRL